MPMHGSTGQVHQIQYRCATPWEKTGQWNDRTSVAKKGCSDTDHERQDTRLDEADSQVTKLADSNSDERVCFPESTLQTDIRGGSVDDGRNHDQRPKPGFFS